MYFRCQEPYFLSLPTSTEHTVLAKCTIRPEKAGRFEGVTEAGAPTAELLCQNPAPSPAQSPSQPLSPSLTTGETLPRPPHPPSETRGGRWVPLCASPKALKAFKAHKSESGISDSVTLSGSYHSTWKLEVIKKNPFLLHRAGVKITEGRCWGWRSSEHPGKKTQGQLRVVAYALPTPGKSQLREIRSLMPFPAGFAPASAPPQLHAAAEPKMPPRASPWPQALPTSPSPPPPHPQPPMPLTPQSPLEPSWCLQPLSYQHPQLHCKHSFHPAPPPVSPSQQVRSTPLHPGLAKFRPATQVKRIKPDLNRRK